MNNLLIQDVAEVYLKDLSDTTKVYFFGLTSRAEVTQTIKQEMLRGGVGNGIYGITQSDKEIKFKVTTLLHNDDLFVIQGGSAFGASASATVMATEQGKITSGKVSIAGTPIGTAVVVIDNLGKQLTGTYATGQVTVSGGVEGSYVTCLYSTSKTGTALPMDTDKFPKSYYVELHTIAYNADTNAVVADVYWQFNKCLPTGGITAVYEAGKNNGDEVEFIAQLPTGSKNYGNYLVVPRP